MFKNLISKSLSFRESPVLEGACCLLLVFFCSVAGSVDDRIKNLAIKRDSTWVEMTGKKLNVLVKQICKIRGHSNWKVRMALAESAGSLLQGCTRYDML